MALRIRAVLGVAAVLVVVVSGDATAQTCDRTEKAADSDAAIAEVTRLERANCLGGTACDTPLCGRLNPMLAPGAAPAREEVAAALREVLDTARQLAQKGSEQGRTLLTQMGIHLAQFVENGRTAAAAWTLEDLTLFADEPHEIDVSAWLESCTDETTCTAASSDAQLIIELATLFRRILIKANEAGRNAFLAQLELLDRQWRAYLASSRGQYPWELALNGAMYRKTAQFDAPPVAQWIVLHPGAGYEITRNAAGRHISESLFVELVGRYRWRWSEDRMAGRVGGSVAAAWRDSGPERRKLGYVVLAYLPRASTVGYVWRPQDGRDEHSLVLSADLVKFLRSAEGIKERLIGARR